MAEPAERQSRFVRKLRHVLILSTDEREALQHLESHRQTVLPQTDLVVQGAPYSTAYILCEGWAIRHKTLPDGKRQILTVLLPGDCVGLAAPLLTIADAAVTTVAPATVAAIVPLSLLEIFRTHPKLGVAFNWHLAHEEAVIAEHLVNVGRRNAYMRVGHLFLELFWRLESVGLVRNRTYTMPLTQTVLADTLGLSPVHVNRTVQRLQRDGLLQVVRSQVVIHNPQLLAETVEFERAYLHLTRLPIWFSRYITRVSLEALRSSRNMQ